jgi:hypothetical protein
MGDGIESVVEIGARKGTRLDHFYDTTSKDPSVRAFNNQIFDAQIDNRGTNTGATVCVPESCYEKCGKLREELGGVALKVISYEGSVDVSTFTVSCDGWRKFRFCQSLTTLYRIGGFIGLQTVERPYHELKKGSALDYAMRAVIHFGAKPTDLVEASRKVRK